MRARLMLPATGLLWTLIAAGCSQSQPAPAENAAETPKPAVTADQQVQKYRDCWSQVLSKDWASFAMCYDPVIEDEAIDSGRPPAKGVEAAVAEARGFLDAFPNLSGGPQLIVASKDHVASIALLAGTHGGPLPGGPNGKPIPATNKPIGYIMGHVVDFNELAITRERQYADNTTLLSQLGVIKAPTRGPMQPASGAPVVAVAMGTAAEATNVETFRANIKAFNDHDPKALAAMNAADAVFHDYTQAKDLDAAGNIATITQLFKGFPDAALTPMAVWGAGDYVVTEGTFSGTSKAAVPMMGIAKATGKTAKIRFLEITKIEAGQIKEDWLVFDTMAFASQLGL